MTGVTTLLVVDIAAMRKSYIFLILLAVFLGGWLVYSHFFTQKVETVKPHVGSAVQAVYATGTVEATVMLPIAPRVTARLMEMHVDEGSEVRKDQVLARLEDADLQQSLQEKRAREEGTRKDYERAALLVKRNVASRQDVDRAKAEWEAAQATRKLAEAQIGFTQLTAPADGRIIRRDGEIGQLIATNQPLFWMSCCAPLRISAEVDEEDIALVQPNQRVLIRADAFPDKIFHGVVQSITPKGDAIARSYRVRIGFSEETPLLIGMTAETNIITGERAKALLIPSTAMDGGFVWLVQEQRLKKQAVKIGIKAKEEVEILSGVTDQDLIALHPQPDWQDGMRIKPRLQISGEAK